MAPTSFVRRAGTLLLLGVLPANAAAQTVRGRVLGEDGSAAVGATIVLLDSVGAVRGGAFVAADGAYSITASQPGRYLLEVQRIGLRNTRSEWFPLAAGQTIDVPLTVSLEAVALPEIEAIGKGRCGKGTDPRVAQVWEEARKALRAAALTSRSDLYRFRIRRHYRQLAVPSLHALRDSSVVYLSKNTGSPFTSLAADTLIARGFIQEKSDGTYYNAPDADVLLSNTFAEAFCFNLKGDRKRDLIGLTFEPVRRNVLSSITGTLWIRRSTSELQYLEYKYMGADVPRVATGLIGGRIHFRRLPNGPWIVDNWYIRMPFYAERQTALRRSTVRQIVLTGISEEGAEVLSINGADAAAEDDQSYYPLTEPRVGGMAVSMPAAPVYQLKPIEVVAPSRKSAARLARGTRLDLLVRDDIARLEPRVRHVGDLAREFPSLRVRELLHRGGTLKGVCIESARSQMALRPSACNSVMVVVDDAPYNPATASDHLVQMLLDLPPNMLESVEYLTSAEAGPRYGTGSKHGALVIYTRGNGPYARNR